MQLIILGSTASIPDINNDSPCFLVNEKYLFDCGFHVLSDLRETGCELSKIKYLFFTHLHHDHYLGLPGLLFYFIHSGEVDISQLTIFGPKEELREVLGYTFQFLQLGKYYPEIKTPNVEELSPGDQFVLDELDFAIGRSNHRSPATSYCITEIKTGKKLGLTGDTVYVPENGTFFKGCNALIHDATLCTCDTDIRTNRISGHSTIYEAILVAEMAGVKRLFPMHMSAKRAFDSVQAVKSLTDIEIIPPVRGMLYQI